MGRHIYRIVKGCDAHGISGIPQYRLSNVISMSCVYSKFLSQLKKTVLQIKNYVLHSRI